MYQSFREKSTFAGLASNCLALGYDHARGKRLVACANGITSSARPPRTSRSSFIYYRPNSRIMAYVQGTLCAAFVRNNGGTRIVPRHLRKQCTKTGDRDPLNAQKIRGIVWAPQLLNDANAHRFDFPMQVTSLKKAIQSKTFSSSFVTDQTFRSRFMSGAFFTACVRDSGGAGLIRCHLRKPCTKRGDLDFKSENKCEVFYAALQNLQQR